MDPLPYLQCEDYKVLLNNSEFKVIYLPVSITVLDFIF